MRKWLCRVLERWLRALGWTPPLEVHTNWVEPEVDPELRQQADVWVAKYDEDRTVSGEYKRHQVYGALVKLFPEVQRYEIGFAIELALWRRREGL